MVGLERDQPSDGDEFLPGLLDAAQGDAEGVGDPGGLDPPAVEASAALEVEASEEVPEDGGDEGRPCAAGQEAEDAAGDRDETPVVGNPAEELPESVAVAQGDDVGRSREGDGRFRPAEQACRLEPAQGVPEPLGGEPGEALELVEAEAAGQGGRAGAAPGDHLAGGEPDAEIDQSDELLAVSPPGQRQADGGDEQVSALGLGKRIAFPMRWYGRGAHAALLGKQVRTPDGRSARPVRRAARGAKKRALSPQGERRSLPAGRASPTT